MTDEEAIAAARGPSRTSRGETGMSEQIAPITVTLSPDEVERCRDFPSPSCRSCAKVGVICVTVVRRRRGPILSRIDLHGGSNEQWLILAIKPRSEP
jgi:hypothetical protein